MSRPRKWRNVCCMPSCNCFGPLDEPPDGETFVPMTIDEYEAVRLIDLEGFTQETCAGQMGIARTTVQRIYNDARTKLAKALVNGLVLKIEGGDYRLCGGAGNHCRCGGCRRRHTVQGMEKEEAATDENHETR